MLTTVPIMTVRKAAAGMLQNLTSKGQPWFYLSVPKTLKDGLTRDQKQALENLTEGCRSLLAKSNAYSAIYRLFVHYLLNGFGCMIVCAADETTDDVIECYTLRPGTYALGIGRNGRVNSVVRKFAWTPMEILEEFGKRNTPEWIRERAKAGSTDYIVVWNLIEPNHVGVLKQFDPIAKACDLGGKAYWRSIFWVDAKGGRVEVESRSRTAEGRSSEQYGVLKIDGFDINPIIAPRLNCELGDTYGRGLRIDGLDLARGLQSFRFDELKVSSDKAQPAVVASSDFKEEGLNLGRGGVNYTRFGEQKQGFVVPVLPQPPSTQDTREMELLCQKELETLFYVDAFTAMDMFRDAMGKVTATQITYAKAEGMQKLGAMVSNCEVEFLNVLVDCVWRWAAKARMTPIDENTVAVIAEMERQVAPEYVSNIHQARRMAELNGIQAWLQNIGETKALKNGDGVNDPADIFDAEKVNTRVREILNVPLECVRDDKEIAAVRKGRAKALAQAQEMEALDKGAGMVNKLGNTPLDEGKLLTPLARAAAGVA